MTTYLNALGLICPIGRNKAEVAAALFAGDTHGMTEQAGWLPGQTLLVGAITADVPELPTGLEHQCSRNNQLLLAAALQIESELRAAIALHGHDRVGVVLGTSTSGIDEASRGVATYLRDTRFPDDYHYQQQELAAPANFLADWLQLSGPAYVVSSACTSSARAILSARRLLDLGLCDAVVCGGVDSLCALTLNGFTALEAMSSKRCNPFSANRDGITIGEAAALFLMSREPSAIALLGAGASSDAHHISAPEPEGRGARQAMCQALKGAGLVPGQLTYLNLHGTGTHHNDAMESIAVHATFPEGIACSSSKPLTGHTLGAAGALELAFCWLSLSDDNASNLLPVHVWDANPDSELPALQFVQPLQSMSTARPRYLMSNSFAFGGNNISLIIGDAS